MCAGPELSRGSDSDNGLFQSYSRATDQVQRPGALLSLSGSRLGVLIRQGSSDFHFTFKVNLFDKVPTSSEVTHYESFILSDARLKVGGIALRGQTLQSFCQSLYQDLQRVSQLVSSYRQNFVAEDVYEIFHKLSQLKLSDARVKLLEIESKLLLIEVKPNHVISALKTVEDSQEEKTDIVSDLRGICLN